MPPRRRRRGYIEQLPSKRFRAVVDAGADPLTGSRRNITETTATYDDAERALARLLHQVDEHQHPKSSITIGEAIEQWLEVAPADR